MTTGAFPLIDGNVFTENRHAIAANNASAHTSYRAWHNLVLSEAPLQCGVFHTHDFDRHGRASGGKGGRAGIGAFSPDDPRASLLVWSARTLWRANLAEAPGRHARQDMR